MKNGILIIDDNEETLETLCLMTRSMQLGDVTGFNNVTDCLEFIKTESGIELVICDWNMPGLTGLELLKTLREGGNLISFIMVTGRNDLDSVLEARRFGVDLYISKPFSTEEMQQKIQWIHSHKGLINLQKTFSD